jgi:hypothetical protein
MIENEEQLHISREWLERFRAALKRLQEEYTDPAEFEFYSVGVRDHIEQIEREIGDYLATEEATKVGKDGRGDETAMTLSNSEMAHRNAALHSEFTRYWLKYDEILEHIPQGARVVLLPDDDPELCEFNLKLAEHLRPKQTEGRSTVFVRMDRSIEPTQVEVVSSPVTTTA